MPLTKQSHLNLFFIKKLNESWDTTGIIYIFITISKVGPEIGNRFSNTINTSRLARLIDQTEEGNYIYNALSRLAETNPEFSAKLQKEIQTPELHKLLEEEVKLTLERQRIAAQREEMSKPWWMRPPFKENTQDK